MHKGGIEMGCNRDVTEHDMTQIIETAGGLSLANHPEAVDLDVFEYVVYRYGEKGTREMLLRQGWSNPAIDELFRLTEAAQTPSVNQEDLARAIAYYGDDTLVELEHLFGDVPGYAEEIVTILNTAAKADIEGMDKVFFNMYEGGYKAISAQQTIEYVMKHLDDIKEVEAFSLRFRSDDSIYGLQGADIVNKDGSIVELKSYNFHSDYYVTNAKQSAEKVIHQAQSRLDHETPQVTIVFAADRGDMPEVFREALEAAIGKQPIKFSIE